MSTEALCEYHDHKAVMEDMKADAEMELYYQTPPKNRGKAPYRRVY